MGVSRPSRIGGGTGWWVRTGTGLSCPSWIGGGTGWWARIGTGLNRPSHIGTGASWRSRVGGGVGSEQDSVGVVGIGVGVSRLSLVGVVEPTGGIGSVVELV